MTNKPSKKADESQETTPESKTITLNHISVSVKDIPFTTDNMDKTWLQRAFSYGVTRLVNDNVNSQIHAAKEGKKAYDEKGLVKAFIKKMESTYDGITRSTKQFTYTQDEFKQAMQLIAQGKTPDEAMELIAGLREIRIKADKEKAILKKASKKS